MKRGALARAFGLAALLLTFGAKAEDQLTYLVHEPGRPSAHPPLLLLLHGAGADERDMIGLAPQLPPEFLVISPRAPFHDGAGYRWYRAPQRNADLAISRKILDLVIQSAIDRFGADRERIFLAGFSQGGVLAYEMGLRTPARFRGVAVLSGSLMSPALAAGDWSHDAIFIGHGTADPRISFASASATKAILGKDGVPVSFHAYPGMGHTISDAETADLNEWLAARLASSTAQ